MSAYIFRSSRPNNWVMPRQYLDENQRKMAFGPIQPMVRIGFIERLLGRH